jgi:hypothetical protein
MVNNSIGQPKQFILHILTPKFKVTYIYLHNPQIMFKISTQILSGFAQRENQFSSWSFELCMVEGDKMVSIVVRKWVAWVKECSNLVLNIFLPGGGGCQVEKFFNQHGTPIYPAGHFI